MDASSPSHSGSKADELGILAAVVTNPSNAQTALLACLSLAKDLLPVLALAAPKATGHQRGLVASTTLAPLLPQFLWMPGSSHALAATPLLTSILDELVHACCDLMCFGNSNPRRTNGIGNSFRALSG